MSLDYATHPPGSICILLPGSHDSGVHGKPASNSTCLHCYRFCELNPRLEQTCLTWAGNMMWDCVQDMLGQYDATLKKMFAWYASLPNLTGTVSWEQFNNNHKGMLSGHLVLLLTDFKVRPHITHWVTDQTQTDQILKLCAKTKLWYALTFHLAQHLSACFCLLSGMPLLPCQICGR